MNLIFETKYWDNDTLVVGVDEVGRGCLAGPVVVGAVCFPKSHQPIDGINDSKQISGKIREQLAPIIHQQALTIGIGLIQATVIDQIGIVAAIRKASDAAIKTIQLKSNMIIVSDGPKPLNSPIKRCESMAIVKGDGLIYSIAAASIVAKVYRDHWMRQQAIKYPQYSWETNVGYGTKKHLEAINHFGLIFLHRQSFC